MPAVHERILSQQRILHPLAAGMLAVEQPATMRRLPASVYSRPKRLRSDDR